MPAVIRLVRSWWPMLTGVGFGLIATWGSVYAAALAPSLSLTSVANGQVVSGVIALGAVADATGLVGVRFQVSGVDVAPEITSGTCLTSWDSRSTGDGAHTVVAIGRDSVGNTVTSAPVLVTVLNASTDATAPTVSVAAPAAGSSVSGTVTITANAQDNTGVAGVWFVIDNATVGTEDTLAPFSFSWNTAGATNGFHTISAIARDASGNSTTSTAITVTVSNASADVTAPSVSLTSPGAGATVSGSVTVTASASDNIGVVGVQFTLDGAALGAEDQTNPYSATWNSSSATNGSHTLRAVARDAAGNTTTSAAISVTTSNVIDTTLPTVSMSSPTGGSTVGGLVTVSANASDNIGVVGVRFTLDGATLGTEDTTAPYSIAWNSAQSTNGSHTLRAVARDAAGNSRTSSSRTVTVSNVLDQTAPTVSVTGPTSGAAVSGAVTIVAAASDNVGVAGIQFKLDGNNLGAEVKAAPYQLSWASNLTLNGSHTLTATARDLAGNTTTAATITVSVNNQGSGVAGDFNGDGSPDLLFQHTTGQLYTWFMNGSSLTGESGFVPGSVPADWQIVGVDDFNADKRSDILWQHAVTGQLVIWLMDRVTLIGELQPPSPGVDWKVTGTGDFNGDGRPDIVWRHSVTGTLYVWFMNGASVLGGGYLTPNQVDSPWRIASVADMNRDGQADLVWQHQQSGALGVWYMNGLTATEWKPLTPAAVPVDWQLRGVADYDRDGNADVVWQNAKTGHLYIWYLNGTRLSREGFLTPSQVATSWQIVGGR